MSMKTLEQELEFFEENNESWRERYLGRFVLVKGRDLVATFDTAEEALTHAASQFGTEPFLVRRVESDDQPIYIPALALGLLGTP